MDEEINRVVVPKDFEDLIPTFMANRKKDVGKLREALAAGDFEALRRLGHRIKGVGASYGFQHITDLAGQIEDAAKAQDRVAAEAKLAEYAEHVERVQISYE